MKLKTSLGHLFGQSMKVGSDVFQIDAKGIMEIADKTLADRVLQGSSWEEVAEKAAPQVPKEPAEKQEASKKSSGKSEAKNPKK